MICPKCKTVLPEEALFCTQCGFKLPKKNQCPYCGADIVESANFCIECGKALTKENIQEEVQRVIRPDLKNKKQSEFDIKKARDISLKGDNSSQKGLNEIKKRQGKSKPLAKTTIPTTSKEDEKRRKIEKKFSINLVGKKWFQCQIEEVKYSTFNNMPNRNVDTAYVVVYNDRIEIYKESVFIKTNMGSRKLYFSNIASIDYDARGVFHASSSAIINTKSAEHVQLKFVSQENFNLMNNAFSNYLNELNKPTPVEKATVNKTTSNADELMKYAELYEKGFLTKEEFDAKKKELL